MGGCSLAPQAPAARAGCEVVDLGLLEYRTAWRYQRRQACRRGRGLAADALILVEHPAVYTRGTTAREGAPPPLPHPVFDVERGGDVTYHGPGQLVGYPILHLGDRGLAVGTYLRALEDVLIAACARLGLAAERLRGFTGVWSRGRKVASIGVATSGWVSYHGFALNVGGDLSPFLAIHPCRLEAAQVASLEALLGRPVPMADAKTAVAAAFRERFS